MNRQTHKYFVWIQDGAKHTHCVLVEASSDLEARQEGVVAARRSISSLIGTPKAIDTEIKRESL